MHFSLRQNADAGGDGPRLAEIEDGTPVLSTQVRASRLSTRMRRRGHARRALLSSPGRSTTVARPLARENLSSVGEVEPVGWRRRLWVAQTEFLFLNESDAPSREEQQTPYQAIALGERSLLASARSTVGGDKPCP